MNGVNKLIKIVLVTVVTVAIGGLSIGSSFGQATTFISRVSIPVSGQTTNSCGQSPEDVQLSGFENAVFRITSDANGGFHISGGLLISY
jgi:hypothetical protein